jgi:uncharacterized protein (DUF2336 family)
MPHNVGELPNSNVGDNRAQPRARDGGPAASQSLIDELEEAIAKHDLHRRAAVMRRLTDFFIVDGAGLSEEHVATFDDVMSRLIVAIDKSARAEFGEMLTRHPNAPKTSRILALDDEIAVAAPVLAHSRSLDDATLIETAKTKSQDHLFAITLRQSIGEAVTDVLVERGNSKVVVSAAGNPGAKFSDFGATTLATRSRDDAELALRVWSRSDIPRQHLLSLFSTATEEVRKQLETADRKNAHLNRSIIAQARNQIQAKMREGSASYAAAQASIEALHRSGELTGERLLEFAQQGKFDEVTVALALMCDLPVGHIERAIMHHQADHLIVLAKAIGLSWETTKAILGMHSPGKAAMTAKLETHCASFAKLQPKSAVAAMQFYRLRARAEAEPETH